MYERLNLNKLKDRLNNKNQDQERISKLLNKLWEINSIIKVDKCKQHILV